jgi:hypothetical protein
MAGVVLMLVCAGLLEGFARQLVQAPVARALDRGGRCCFSGCRTSCSLRGKRHRPAEPMNAAAASLRRLAKRRRELVTPRAWR